MKKFEYKLVGLTLSEVDTGGMKLAEVEADANKLGAEGWELVYVHAGRVAVFIKETEVKSG